VPQQALKYYELLCRHAHSVLFSIRKYKKCPLHYFFTQRQIWAMHVDNFYTTRKARAIKQTVLSVTTQKKNAFHKLMDNKLSISKTEMKLAM
jgi:hypothetical protein